MSKPGDIELMRLEAETLWATDDRGRITTTREPVGVPAPHLVIARAVGGQFSLVGSAVSDGVDAELHTMVAAETGPFDPAATPPVMAACMEILTGAVGPVELASGPTYLLPLTAEFPFTGSAELQTSACHEHRDLPPPPNWSAAEWAQLLAGELGPWALAIEDGHVGALCHSARLTERAAEAGVWTDPRFRGRGLAAAATAAWASVMEPSGRVLFYSTSAENVSSQRVAARLGLRQIGWLWQFKGTDERESYQITSTP